MSREFYVVKTQPPEQIRGRGWLVALVWLLICCFGGYAVGAVVAVKQPHAKLQACTASQYDMDKQPCR